MLTFLKSIIKIKKTFRKVEFVMDELFKILKSIKKDVDFTKEKNLVDEEILTSLEMLELISAIEEKFEIEIPAESIIPENFQSAETIFKLITDAKEGKI